ncbi:MAG: winged helix-turn-helix transcriptional regulator [Anaerolineae bacterium]|nr:winged helix-turn-helix transcriptional regulator [Anaerolineae bacterium]
MNAQIYEKAARCLKALDHPARLRILAALRYGEQCVCHLEALLDKSQAYVSQQLAILREAGLVQDRKEGQRVYYAIADDRLPLLLDLLLGESLEDSPAHEQLPTCRCPACQVAMAA